MFLQICQKLEFPRESLPALETAHRTMVEDLRVARAFATACQSLLHPDGNVFPGAVLDSLKQGYARFCPQFPGGVVPFVTDTWLLYPPYMDGVFPKDGNVQKFAALFHILGQYVDESYENFPSVFGCPFRGADLSALPQNTRLQRNLLAYLRQGNPMGGAYGILLYGPDGILNE